MGILRLGSEYIGHRIDIRIIEDESWAYGLLYFTGSKNFNIYLRQSAKKLQLTLNEYQLYNNNSKYPATTEHDIFKHLNIPYVDPCNRL